MLNDWIEGEIIHTHTHTHTRIWASLSGSSSRESASNAGAIGVEALIPGSGRYPGGGNDIPLQYSCLENTMDRGSWWVQSMGLQKNQTWLKWLSKHAYMYMNIHVVDLHTIILICSPWTETLVLSFLYNSKKLRKLTCAIERWKFKASECLKNPRYNVNKLPRWVKVYWRFHPNDKSLVW